MPMVGMVSSAHKISGVNPGVESSDDIRMPIVGRCWEGKGEKQWGVTRQGNRREARGSVQRCRACKRVRAVRCAVCAEKAGVRQVGNRGELAVQVNWGELGYSKAMGWGNERLSVVFNWHASGITTEQWKRRDRVGAPARHRSHAAHCRHARHTAEDICRDWWCRQGRVV